MKMHALLLVASAAGAAATSMEQDPDFPTFQRFMNAYNRRYTTQSEVLGRFEIFKDNLQRIAERNQDGGQDVHGINQFTDLHPNEFAKMYLGTRLSGNEHSDMKMQKQFNATELQVAPKAIDWRTKGATTAVKNQGQCGSCWAFSATEQIESQTFLDTGVLNVLSPQQIVSCDTVDGGCNGGNPVNAYYYANTAGGVEYESDYPYTSGTTQVDGTCTFDAADVAPNTTPQTYSIISQSPSQEANIYTQIQTTPMSICVDATIWQTYTGGIITPSDACGTSINHAVQLVGIGSSGSTYYIVRNSWSSSWGEDGFIYLATGSNVCGITSEATIVNL